MKNYTQKWKELNKNGSFIQTIFRVFPFGIKEDFGHKLIKFKLSRIAAFYAVGTK